MDRTSGAGAPGVVVIGAGMGGLAAAIRLAAAGRAVTVIEAMAGPGGKMRVTDSAAGPVDAGPTVLTMRGVFDGLFAAAGANLEDHVTLIPQPILARHWWPDGSSLDLHADAEAGALAVRAFAGAQAEQQFRRFAAEAATLHRAFEGPVMMAAEPSATGIAAAALRNPGLWPALMPGATLARHLARRFRDPRLAQLFGRYATYVGGSPYRSPAVLALIWHAEASGVWAVQGGMHGLARAMAAVASGLGVRFRYDTRVDRILTEAGRVCGVALAGGGRTDASEVIFNGDPAALATGRLGPAVRAAVPETAVGPRSHSAYVWSFAARATGAASGRPLALHNVFFCADPAREFGPIMAGRMPEEASLYVCAQDRADGSVPAGHERFEIILNAPPTDLTATSPSNREDETCRTLTFETLARFGLTFDPPPGPGALTGPAQFARMFPGSKGSIYGRSPHGITAAFRRPAAATRIPGLWIAGGGTHPGAGMPMAVLSGINAAEAVLRPPGAGRRVSMSASIPTATRGGTSTGSATTAAAPSRS